MRVVHLITGLGVGGTETALLRLLRQLDRRVVQSTVVSMTGGGVMADRIRAAGIPVDDLGMRRGLPNPLAVGRLHARLRRERPDILQTWLYHADLLGMVSGSLARVPAIAWNIRCSSMDERYVRGLNGLTVRLLARCSGLPAAIVSNSKVGIHYHQGLGYRARRWAMIPNGFDVDAFRPDQSARRDVRAELGLDAGAALIGLVARYDPVKDHRTFLRAAAQLAPRQPDAHFVLVGAGIDRNNAQLAPLANDPALAGRLHMLGERSDVPRLTAALDVATCASTSEGFPNIVGEAMACGVPVVTTDVGAARLVVGATGSVVPAADPTALAAGWGELLALDASQRIALGSAARDRIVQEYSIAATAAQYADLYRSLRAA